METDNTGAPHAAQPIDWLRAALRGGEAIRIDFLAIWPTPDIPDVCDGRKLAQRHNGDELVLRGWRKSELSLKARFGEILLSYTARECLKRQVPRDDAQLIDWVHYVLNLIWAWYSRAVQLERRGSAFRDYVRQALMREPYLDSPALTEAAQALRLSLGLPRFRPPTTPCGRER
jgi:hypothetical protein